MNCISECLASLFLYVLNAVYSLLHDVEDKYRMLPLDILMKTKEKQRHKGSSLTLSMKLMDVQ